MGGDIILPAKARRNFSEVELERLRADYRAYVDGGRLTDLAAEMGRSKSVLSEKARALGLTDGHAARKAAAKAVGDARRGKPLAWEHPRGFAGKRHSTETRGKLRIASAAFWGSLSAEEHEAQVTTALKAAIAKNGRIGPITPNRATTWKAGWREIADKRHYFRSRWEANYARYLQWLKERGEILDWEYEPETFWFDKIKRGVRSYLPDFRVHELNGSKPIHEVKGWMDARSRTTLKRMAKYHPAETIILIREKDYRAISRFSAMIGDWE
ncbi:DUF1064 domain-containing protein [Sphingomonas sp. SRS2]|uniref:DUF1064 domain-containing protein n=1 Tax=Sphingomonas sp. SRS2 TaxID=133190 RepID=UPI00061841EC|nr:DUF1064 domain-containing protein [Sphingomonas sp. SRS2]KKC25814.1 hypothetical protein WP12_12225 [Sphingomonas sp. SRS2]